MRRETKAEATGWDQQQLMLDTSFTVAVMLLLKLPCCSAPMSLWTKLVRRGHGIPDRHAGLGGCDPLGPET